MLQMIYVIRHGSRSDWEGTTNAAFSTGLFNDFPLSERGLEQIKHVTSFMLRPAKDQPIPQLIFSSPLCRAVQSALPLAQRLSTPIRLEHGFAEYYAPVIGGTGLQVRPDLKTLLPLCPAGSLDAEYKSTFYPSRKGETIQAFRDRSKACTYAFINRLEAERPDVTCIAIYGHAATAIGVGEALTGKIDTIYAPICSVSKYDRTALEGAVRGPLQGWQQEWNGKYDFLPDGAERAWTLDEVSTEPDGTVTFVPGDGEMCKPEDLFPEGIAPGLEEYLRGYEGGQTSSA